MTNFANKLFSFTILVIFVIIGIMGYLDPIKEIHSVVVWIGALLSIIPVFIAFKKAMALNDFSMESETNSATNWLLLGSFPCIISVFVMIYISL